MMKTLIIIPTKDRINPINCLLVNLASQCGNFDVLIVDQTIGKDYEADVYFRGCINWLENLGHKCVYIKSIVGNQHDSCNMGLMYANDNGYDVCFVTDDDILYEEDYIYNGIQYMEEHPECGVLTGYTLCPMMSMEEQTMTEFMRTHKDFSGKIEDMGDSGFEHCIYIDPTLHEPKEFETLFGPFFFRTEDAINVGGFPTHLSKYGNRGEIMLKIAIGFTGKKLILNPYMISWHYSNKTGGMRTDNTSKEDSVKYDFKKFDDFIKRRIPYTGEP